MRAARGAAEAMTRPAATDPARPGRAAASEPDAPCADALARCIEAVARAGDRRAFAELFAHFAPRLKAFFVRGGMPAAEAEELAQDAMLAVWRKAALFDPAKAGAATWIYTVARNLRTDALRRAPPPGAPVAEADAAAEPGGAAGADEAIAASQQARGVRDALLRLPAEQAEVLRLAFFGGKSQTEIARALRLPLGTVKSRARLALARLRQAAAEALR